MSFLSNDGSNKKNLHFDNQSKQVDFLFFVALFSKLKEIEKTFSAFPLNNRVLSRNYRLIAAPQIFANMLVLRTSNFREATISP